MFICFSVFENFGVRGFHDMAVYGTINKLYLVSLRRTILIMDRIQIALAKILIKRDMLIPYTYRDIARKYNVCEATLRYYVKKYGDQQPRLDKFFLEKNSRTIHPSRSHI